MVSETIRWQTPLAHMARTATQDFGFKGKRIREGMQFTQGLADSTLIRDESWLFFCLGRSLERADQIARILVLQAPLLTAASDGRDDMVRWLAVLRSCGAA